MKRKKNSNNENDKNDENDYKKDKVEITYELDDILYNNSKSFSKSKNKYYKIKKENDEFLEFYKFNKHHKSRSMNSKKKYDNSSKDNDKNEIEINEEDDDHCYDAFNNDDYLLIKEQDDIFFHFLNKSQNERKYYKFQGPYKYINKMKRYIKTKSFDINTNDKGNDKDNAISEKQNKNSFVRRKEKHKYKTMYIKEKSRNGKLSPNKNTKIRNDIIKGHNFKTIKINSKDKNITKSSFNNMEKIKTHNNLNINKLKIDKNMYGSNNKLINVEHSKHINLSNKNLNMHFENNDKLEIFNDIKKEMKNKYENKTINNILNDNSNITNTIDNNNINFYTKDEDETKINLKRGLITNFSNYKNNYKINNNNIKNKISFRNKVDIKNEKTFNRNNFFNKALKSFTKSNAQKKALNNNNATINICRNNVQIKLKIKNKKLSEQRIINSQNINVKKSNLNLYYSNLNKYKTINISNNTNSNKSLNILQRISNSTSNKSINNIHSNKNVSQNILMKENENNIEKYENNYNDINDISLIKDFDPKSLNKERKGWIFSLYEEQKDKLNKKDERSIPNIRRRTYDKLILYNKDLISIKERKNNNTSFLTAPNNLNYSKILDKKYIINLNSLVDDIKSKNKDNRMYQFLRDELYNNKLLTKIEKDNKYLSNFDKHFIKKYTQFQTLISNEDDNL